MDFTISTRPAEFGLEYGLETTSGNDGLQSTPGIDDLSCLDGSMTSDCLPGTPRAVIIKQLLKLTFAVRRMKINSSSSSTTELVQEYKMFKHKDWVN